MIQLANVDPSLTIIVVAVVILLAIAIYMGK